jgi:uncharacterized protein DUF4230
MRRLKQIFWTAILALAAFLGFTLSHWLKPGSGLRFENTDTVVQQVQTLSDLVTVKYIMEKVVIEDAPPNSTFGQFFQGNNRVLLLAHGIVKAGINLKGLQPADVRVSGQKIFIHLPPAEITDAYLDEQQTKVIDWQRGFLRDFDKDLESTARQAAVEDIRRAARSAGILKDADERARLELAVFLNRAGYAKVEFSDHAPEIPILNALPKN